MAWCLGLERLLLDVADAFENEGIEFLVLKGPAVARAAYPDPSWRVFHDIDVLVRTEDWRRAVTVLQRDFGPRRIPEPRPGWDERFGKGAVFMSEGGRQIDLHRTLVKAPFALWINAEELFLTAEDVLIAGGSVRHPDASALFVHAAAHAVLGDGRPRLHGLRDMWQVAAKPIDWQRVKHLAATWRLGAALDRAIQEMASRLGVAVDVDICRAVPRTAHLGQQVAMAAFAPTAPRWAAATLTLIVAPTLRARWEFVRGALTPRQRLGEGSAALRRAAEPRARPRETGQAWTSS
jgi:hypothetical protein